MFTGAQIQTYLRDIGEMRRERVRKGGLKVITKTHEMNVSNICFSAKTHKSRHNMVMRS